MMEKKYYLVVITEWDEYRNSYLFKEKWEAKKFIKHNFLENEDWKQFIEEKEVGDE